VNISLEWISEYVDIANIDPESIAHELTMSCAEVEELHSLHRYLDRVVVGEIVEMERLSHSDHLARVIVDTGTELLTTVCGAPNIEVGTKSAVAGTGARLAGGVEISHSRIGGVTSQGTLCSACELGFSDLHEGILILPHGTKNGTPLANLVPKDDTIVEIDNKSLSHRPDLWGHYGIAREIAAITHRELAPPPTVDTGTYRNLPRYPISIDDSENCRCYACIGMEGVESHPSPLFVQWRLHAIGQRARSMYIDLSNYVMFELGQPMHAFDSDKINRVRVAPFGKKGRFLALDGIERELIPEDLMIWSNNDPIALAGIMGGQDSEIEKRTTKLLLESANFKGSRVRRTASRLGLRTEASQRFEKNQPPANTRVSIARFLYLAGLGETPPRVTSRLTIVGNTDEERDPIVVPVQFFHEKIGTPMSEDAITSILDTLGFHSSLMDHTLHVSTPSFRSREDISIAEDIVEEVARIYGYGNIGPVMPKSTLRPVVSDPAVRAEHQIRKLLAASHGFHEVHTYAWFDDRWLRSIAFDPTNHLTVRNPAADYSSRLRTTLMPNLLGVVHRNTHYAEEFRVFEIGRVFAADSDEEVVESSHLCGICYRHSQRADPQQHYTAAKAAIEDLLEVIYHVSPVYRPADEDRTPWQAAGTYADITIADSPVGCIGILPKNVADVLSPGAQVVWFDCDLSAMAAPLYPDVKYREPWSFQGSSQDFSIVWDRGKGFAQLEHTLDRFKHSLVRERRYIGMYQGKGLPERYGSYSFRYWIGHKDRTLERAEIGGFIDDFTGYLRQEGLELRT
jgi:phenylalanyl-tRNA synthetase beta chain